LAQALVACLAALLLLFAPPGASGRGRSAAVCGDAPAVSSSQDRLLVAFARRVGLGDAEAFKNIANALHERGALPPCYLTKAEAGALGWHPSSDLWSRAPGRAIGGDVFYNREGVLPAAWNGRYVEADLDYAGGDRGAHRLIYVRGMEKDWLIFVTVDHYRSFTRFESVR
jgi:hypothetical protein